MCVKCKAPLCRVTRRAECVCRAAPQGQDRGPRGEQEAVGHRGWREFPSSSLSLSLPSLPLPPLLLTPRTHCSSSSQAAAPAAAAPPAPKKAAAKKAAAPAGDTTGFSGVPSQFARPESG
eukprot:307243-Rhodomonas_salina.3